MYHIHQNIFINCVIFKPTNQQKTNKKKITQKHNLPNVVAVKTVFNGSKRNDGNIIRNQEAIGLHGQSSYRYMII